MEGTLVLDQNRDTLLYAGVLKLNITDWFFLKDDVVLNYVGLDDATIYINRKDSTWNYQFLVDYFSSPAPKKKSDNPIQLDLDVVELNRLRIWQQDEWKGQNFLAALKRMELHADKFDIRGKHLNFKSVEIEDPQFAQYDYEGNRPDSLRPKKTGRKKLIPGEGQWNAEGWEIFVKRLDLTNGSVIAEREVERQPYTDRFDDKFIKITKINTRFRDFLVQGDTISSKLNLSAVDRNGFQLKTLAADLVFTPDIMEFNNLDITTEKSHLGNYFAMKYEDFVEDMNDFVHAVRLEGRFVNTTVDSDELAYFAPDTKNWNTVFTLNGLATGPVDNLKTRNVRVSAGNTYLAGNVSLKGLPDISDTYIEADAKDFRTNYSELIKFVPSLKTVTQPRISEMGNVRYKGNFNGYIDRFSAAGNLSSDLGSLQLDVTLRLPASGVTTYKGTVSTNGFQVGRFLNNDQLGNVAFSGKVDGKGVRAKNINLAFNGFIDRLDYNGYTYKNIRADGLLAKDLFSGRAVIDDPNLRVSTLNGSINFSGAEPQLNFFADVQEINLKNLHLTKDSLLVTGVFDLQFSGSNIDNFLGTANLYNATLVDNGKQLSFDSLVINSDLVDGSRHLVLQSNELTADLRGDFKILELPQAFQLFLNRYYPAFVNNPNKKVDNQNFTFDIKTNNVSEYINLFDKKVSGLDNANITGYLNVADNRLDLTADIPVFSYRGMDARNIHLAGNGNRDTLTFHTEIEDVIVNDSLHSPGTIIDIVAANDVSDLKIVTSANKTLNAADLSARVLTSRDGFDLRMNPSTFTINGKQWKIENGGRLELIKDMFIASNFELSEDGQKVYVSTEPSAIGMSNDVVIGLQNFDIGDVSPLFTKVISVDGNMTGQIRINDPFDRPSVDFDTKTTEFYFENDSIGVLSTRGEYIVSPGYLSITALSDNYPYNFTAELKYRVADSTEDQIQGTVLLNSTSIHIMEKYLGGIFQNINGRASGQLNIYGNNSDPKLTGSIRLDSTTMTVDYTQCRYILEDNSILNFRPDEIDLGVIKIKDTLNGTATVTGKVYHSFFDNFFFNELHVKTDEVGGQPAKFVLLNTTSSDNKQFYGNVIGDAELSLNGFVNDMRLNISGQPTDSSHIYLPTGETAETGSLDYIDFTRFGREMSADLSFRENTNIKVDMDLVANPFAKIDVVLDETTGDVIKAQGNGRLHISAGTRDPLTIRGRYEVEEGEYTFNFQTFLKTPFSLQTGYIEWQGDPYQANLNIDAVYTAQNVMLNNIPTSAGFSNTKGDVNILFKLRGTLADPRPEFEFQFPFDNPLKNDPIANSYLKTRFEADKNELNKQVTSLLLFNTFMSTDQRLLSTTNTGNFVTRSVGQLLSATLSSSLNNWLQKVLNTRSVNLYTNINTADFGFGITQREIQNIGNFGLRTAFFNNKLLVKVGGNVDYRVGQAASNSNSNFLFTPDVSFEYLVTPDGRVRVIGFNRSDADLGDISGATRRNRTGVQISYRKEFDSFTEFFLNEDRRRPATQLLINQKAMNN